MKRSSIISVLALILSCNLGVGGTYWTSGVSSVYLQSNQSVTTGSNLAFYDVDYVVSSSSIEPANINTANYVQYLVTASGQEVIVRSYSVASGPVDNQTLISFEQTVKEYNTAASPDVVQFNLLVSNVGSTDAYGLYVNIDLTTGMDIDYGSINVNTTEFAEISNKNKKNSFTWTPGGNFTVGESRYLTFTAEPAGPSGTDMQQTTIVTSSLYYTTVYQGSDFLGPIDAEVALIRGDSITKSLLYQHGFTALTFFLSFLFGMAAVILIIVIFMLVRRRQQRSTRPGGLNETRILREQSTRLMMEVDMKKGGNTILDYRWGESFVGYSTMEEGESIVGVLANKDRLQRFREIDGLDIVSTVKTDMGIEQQRNESSTNAMTLLIQGLKHNKDITPAVEDEVITNFKKKKMKLDSDMDEEYKREMKKLYKKLSAKNKAIMSRKLQQHRESKKQLVSETGHLGDDEKKDLLDMMNKQHQTEVNEESYRLKLEQDEEAENLRKEFAIRKRMGLKEIEQGTLDELKEKGNLDQQKVDWLLKEHKNTQGKLEKMYDEEISRQRMLLEEKLERRKALAKASEQQEDDHSDLLNTIAGQQVGLVQRAKKQGIVDDDTADELIDKAKQEMISLKEKLDKDKERQEAELQKKLSAMKKQRLAEKKKQHEADLLDYEKEHKSQQTDGPIDPVSYMEGKLNLQSQQRHDLLDLENQVDEDHAEELRNLHEDMVEQTKEQLHLKQDQLVNRLQQEGMTESKMRTLLNQYDNQVKKLQEEQKRAREEQEIRLKEKLSKNRQEWKRRKEAEKAEQEQLREHENKVVNKLINGQMSMSEDERNRILKEHEKQMVKLENSLTLNKLRQKRMLEEKLAHKRSQQMMLLQQKHMKESDKLRRTQENNGEESDEESHTERLKLMKRQAEQRMAILQGNKLDLDDEMESVRVEMLKQRALALRDQEERLGAMVATLQVSKAREMAKIEEQQKAINNLKVNLMDDLNARGILTDPESQQILQRHKDAQDELNNRIEQQRAKQEKMLKQRLKDRLDQREKSMLEAQDEEIRRIMGTSKSKTAIKIKKVLLIHKHMVEMEKFRNTLDREVAQVLEDVKQQFEVKRLQALQDQELEFVAGLIAVGAFKQHEVIDVLHILFPTKSDKQLKEIMAKIYNPVNEKSASNVDEHGPSTLIDRIKDTQLTQQLNNPSPRLSQRSAPTKKPRKKKQEPVAPIYSDDDETVIRAQNGYTYLDARPEPIGEVVQAQPVDDFDLINRQPHEHKHNLLSSLDKRSNQQHARLPPLEPIQAEGKPGKKRKKNKLLKKLSHKPQDDNYYDDDELL